MSGILDNTAILDCVNKWLTNVVLDQSNKYVSGYVEGSDFEDFMNEYRAVSGISFATRYSRAKERTGQNVPTPTSSPKTNDGKNDESSSSSVGNSGRLFWSLNTKTHPVPFIGSPFLVRKTEIKHCIFGKDHHKKKSTVAAPSEHGYFASNTNEKKTRNNLRGTVKKDCEAKINIKEITLFHTYKADENAKRKLKDDLIKKLTFDRTQGVNIDTISRYYVEVPLATAHNHSNQVAVLLSNKIDVDVAKKIYSLVSEGISEVRVVKLLLNKYVKEELFLGKQKPSELDRSFYPHDKDIINHIRLSIVRQKSSKIDQEELFNLIEKWKAENPDSKFHFRPYTCNDDNVKEGLLFVHQEKWQSVLLQKYGELFLMDATYKTMKYDLPLFFICIKTNMCYVVVGQFIIMSENEEAISEALEIFRTWNTSWVPKFAMVDFSEAEINSIEEKFPGILVYLCDFHREQSWVRWMRKSEHGFNSENEKNAKNVLRRIAGSMSKDELADNLQKLDISIEYNNNEKYRKWLKTKWLNEATMKRWVRLYRHQTADIIIHTNNGIERQNKTLKHNYLINHKDKSLSGVVSVIRNGYLPDLLRKYTLSNVEMSCDLKSYKNKIDSFLHNRPANMIKHVMDRKDSATQWSHEEVLQQPGEVGIFMVKSHTMNCWYTINFNEPSCSCIDWKSSHWPCKHILAIFNLYPSWDWEKFPAEYRNSPYNNADKSFYLCPRTATIQCMEYPSLPNIQDEPQPSTSQVQSSIILPGPRKNNLTKERARLVTKMKEMISLVYNCSNVDDLRKVYDKIDFDDITNTLQSNVVKENGLPLIAKEAVNQKKVKSLRCNKLPLMRKDRYSYKYRNRVGVSADNWKTALTKINVNANLIIKAKAIKKNALKVRQRKRKAKAAKNVKST